MLKNNNSTAVKRISRRLIKNNRVRNVFSVLAIILATVMFITVFTICFSIETEKDKIILAHDAIVTRSKA